MLSVFMIIDKYIEIHCSSRKLHCWICVVLNLVVCLNADSWYAILKYQFLDFVRFWICVLMESHFEVVDVLFKVQLLVFGIIEWRRTCGFLYN